MKSYNSKYSLEYYTIGDAYQFYFTNISASSKASADEIARFGDLFDDDELISQSPSNSIVNHSPLTVNTSNHENLQRYVGIVIEKTQTSTNGRITVLFKSEQAGYIKVIYGCALSKGVSTDGKNYMPAQKTIVQDNGNQKSNVVSGITLARDSNPKKQSHSTGKPASGISGITLDNRQEKSGITLSNRNQTPQRSISGVTLANREQLTPNLNSNNASRIKLSRKTTK